jgi:hypothetical protein
VQWAAFLRVFIDHDAAQKYAENIPCCFDYGWKGEVWENLQIFKERQQKELYHCENSIFFLSYFELSLKTWDRNFPFLSDNAHFKCT